MDEIVHLKYKDIKKIREDLLSRQDHICPICAREVNSPVLDHHHCRKPINGSGCVRGVLCSGCNILVGKIENNCVRFGIPQNRLSQVLINIARYISKPPYHYMHPSEAPKKPKLTLRSYKKLLKVSKVKVPKYSGNYTKKLKQLFDKYKIKPEFYKK